MRVRTHAQASLRVRRGEGVVAPVSLSVGRVIGYRRCSTSEQAASGLGLDVQQNAIETVALKLGFELAAVYTDAGLSGSLSVDDRPQLAGAIAALRRGDILAVMRRDRLARDSLVAALIEREVSRRGCRIVSSQGEGTGDDDPSSVFVRRVLDAVSEFERLLIGQRTRSAMAAARARGQVVGRVPFGHRLAADSKYLELDAAEQAILMEIRLLRAKGYALADIAQTLNARGVRNRAGRLWRRQFIGQLLERHGNGGLP